MKQVWKDLKERWPIVILAVLWCVGFVLINK